MPDGFVEPALIEAAAAKLADELPVRVKDLHAFVAGIGHQHVPLRIDGESTRPVEQAVIPHGWPVHLAQCAPTIDERAVRLEVLDAVIPGVRHVDRSVRPCRYAPRFVERALRCRRIGHLAARRADRHDVLAVRSEFLHPMIEAIRHVDRSVGRNRDRVRRLELAVLRPGRAPDLNALPHHANPSRRDRLGLPPQVARRPPLPSRSNCRCRCAHTFGSRPPTATHPACAWNW